MCAHTYTLVCACACVPIAFASNTAHTYPLTHAHTCARTQGVDPAKCQEVGIVMSVAVVVVAAVVIVVAVAAAALAVMVAAVIVAVAQEVLAKTLQVATCIRPGKLNASKRR